MKSEEKKKNEDKANPTFNTEELEHITTLEKLADARRNLLQDVEKFMPDVNDGSDPDEDNDGLKDYRGIF